MNIVAIAVYNSETLKLIDIKNVVIVYEDRKYISLLIKKEYGIDVEVNFLTKEVKKFWYYLNNIFFYEDKENNRIFIIIFDIDKSISNSEESRNSFNNRIFFKRKDGTFKEHNALFFNKEIDYEKYLILPEYLGTNIRLSYYYKQTFSSEKDMLILEFSEPNDSMNNYSIRLYQDEDENFVSYDICLNTSITIFTSEYFREWICSQTYYSFIEDALKYFNPVMLMRNIFFAYDNNIKLLDLFSLEKVDSIDVKHYDNYCRVNRDTAYLNGHFFSIKKGTVIDIKKFSLTPNLVPLIQNNNFKRYSTDSYVYDYYLSKKDDILLIIVNVFDKNGEDLLAIFDLLYEPTGFSFELGETFFNIKDKFPDMEVDEELRTVRLIQGEIKTLFPNKFVYAKSKEEFDF